MCIFYLFILFTEKKNTATPIDNRVANNDNCHYIELFAQSMKM